MQRRPARLDAQRGLKFQRPERQVVPMRAEVAHRAITEIPPAIPLRPGVIDLATMFSLLPTSPMLLPPMLAIRGRTAGLRPAAASTALGAFDNPESTNEPALLRLTEPRSVGVFWQLATR